MIIIILKIIIILFLILILFFNKVLITTKLYKNKSENIVKKSINFELPDVKETGNLNKTIYQTYKDIDLVPKYYIENIKKLNPEWNYEFYDDKRARDLLKDNFNKEILDKYDSFKSGAHRADLWRLCILYLYGGFYFDIDVMLYEKLDNIIEGKENELLIAKTVVDAFFYKKERLFNAVIFCKAGNPIIKKCINSIMNIKNSDLKYKYHLILYIMQLELGDSFNYRFLEKTKSDNFSIKKILYLDKYFIYDDKNKLLGESKREDY